jgi:hypothetical protein
MGRTSGAKNVVKNYYLDIYNIDTKQWDRKPFVFESLYKIAEYTNLSYASILWIYNGNSKKLGKLYKITKKKAGKLQEKRNQTKIVEETERQQEKQNLSENANPELIVDA